RRRFQSQDWWKTEGGRIVETCRVVVFGAAPVWPRGFCLAADFFRFRPRRCRLVLLNHNGARTCRVGLRRWLLRLMGVCSSVCRTVTCGSSTRMAYCLLTRS